MTQGMLTSLSDTATTAVTISNLVRNIDPMDVPCISYFGTNNQSRLRLVSFPNHKWYWIKDTLRTRTTTLGAAVSDTSGTSITLTDASLVKEGDVFLVDTEQFLVQSVNTTTNVVTVGTRGTSTGTTAATHSNAATVTYLFSARLEGAQNDQSPFVVPTTEYNQSQILHGSISISRSEQRATTRYGVSDTYKYQLMKWLGGLGGGNGTQGRAGDLMIDLENTFFYGQRIARTTSQPGMMGGFAEYVTTNATDLNSVLLTQDTLEDSIQSAWSYGGKPNVIICNAFNKRLISSWYAPYVTTERSERTGGVVISKVETEFGLLDVMLNRRCPAATVYIAQRDDIGWVTLDNWQVERLGKTGDSTEDQIVGEFSFFVGSEKAHAIITETATS